ncbi:pentapeptide repeat-containing protein [Streptomyces albus]|uniref:pentapeptide repeat-containing protein n=1 Tax=Streptomyces albus TaxID=1888 RepID=UPI0024ACCEAE|nr:pentapeptide repeat-containing protein [Streptomyces albus]MDI6413122.1 pentapeptide repeat-containing protein [Streptomyces albus]
MAENRGPRPTYDRELRLWKVGRALSVTFVAAVLVAGGVFYGLVYVLDFQEIGTAKRLDAKTLFDLVKLSFGVVAGAGALVALVVSYRRQRVDEAGAHREATRLHTERFSQAVEQLGSDSPAVQLGGVHALAGLADDAPDDSLRQTCIDVLCAYLQLPFTPDPGDDPAHQEEHHRYLALRKVRHTILRLIGDHYRRPQGTHRSWQGCDLNLTGVIIDGSMDFTGATFSSGTVTFGNATFSEGAVSFDGATFSGGTVTFYGATLSGSMVTFGNATFSDGTVTFDHATFSDRMVTFDGATFSGGTVTFDEAEFSGSTVTFDGATFSGGTVTFYGAEFSGGTVTFGNAKFSGGMVTFDHAEFSGGTVFFYGAEFSGGTVTFDDAEFSGSAVTFGNATLSGSAVTFYGATLSGSTVSFDDAAGSPPHGLLDAVGTPVPATVELPAAWLSSNP